MSFVLVALFALNAQAQPDRAPVVFSQTVHEGGSTIQVDFAAGPIDLGRAAVVGRIQMAAHAVAAYYGRFPVAKVRVLVIPAAGRHGVMQGTTWGAMSGFPAFLRLRIGQQTTADEFKLDWVMTHELTHTALASLPDDQHWIEEGIASYVEPIARVQAGEIAAQSIWEDMVRGMPNGEPANGDRGLDHTHTWGRTYWGGALFCLSADVEIRRQTQNLYGLQDALRAIVASGDTIDKEMPVAPLLRIGDVATHTHVLEDMYARWSSTAVPVDLPALWKQLGVKADGSLDDAAPESAIRRAITALPR
jgi:hypothetical protein